jgi:hypothetical protein
MAELLKLWVEDGSPTEDHAHARGLHPDPERGQRDSVFLYGTPEGEEILMWEPGPDILGSPDQDQDEDEADSEGPDPWATAGSTR